VLVKWQVPGVGVQGDRSHSDSLADFQSNLTKTTSRRSCWATYIWIPRGGHKVTTLAGVCVCLKSRTQRLALPHSSLVQYSQGVLGSALQPWPVADGHRK